MQCHSNAVAAPLFVAVEQGQFDAVDALICAGAEVDVHGQRGVTPLQLACYQGRPSVIRRLLRHGADARAANDDGHTALHCAVIGSMTHDPGTGRYVRCESRDLHPRRLEALRTLLSAPDADIDGIDEHEMTPAHWAVELDDMAMLGLLHRHGADLRKPGPNGLTPHALARSLDHEGAMRVLEQLGVER